MKKKIVATSLILVLIPSLLFSVLYGIMYYVIYHGGDDFTAQAAGSWHAVQYLSDKQLYPCSEEKCLGLEVREDSLTVTGTLLTPGDYSMKWDTGSIMRVQYGDEELIFVVSVNSLGQMKITINALHYIITFERDAS